GNPARGRLLGYPNRPPAGHRRTRLARDARLPIGHTRQGAAADYLGFDRELLPYLNIIEKLNCFYCSYGNGIAAYTREVAARTEQYWCPIMHARRIRAAHERYPNFFDHGDAEAFQQGLDRLRRQYGEVAK
ncbi:MAG: hypothetical protein WCD32_06420, partial [Azonexus sp.]